MPDDFDSLRQSRGEDEPSPEIAAQMDAAKAQFHQATDEIAKFIGYAVMSGKTDAEIVEDLETMGVQLKRDAAVNDYRVELNPMEWALGHAIRCLKARRG